MTVNEYLEANRSTRDHRVPAIVCADGLRMSVQASEYHYCEPRINCAPHYSAVEVGFPSEPVAELMEYAETPETPTATVYGWVPVEVVETVIAAHGGIKKAVQS